MKGKVGWQKIPQLEITQERVLLSVELKSIILKIIVGLNEIQIQDASWM